MEDEKMTEEEMKEALMDRNESKTTTCQNRFRSNWNRYTFFQKYPAKYETMVTDFCVSAYETEYPDLKMKKEDLTEKFKAITKVNQKE